MLVTAPLISSYMTPQPYTIAPEATLAAAMDMIETYRIHHLPVREQDRLIGVLSLHDLSLVALHSQRHLKDLDVRSAMNRHVYTISPETPLHLVAARMADHKLTSALVVQSDGSLLGIFTESDALHALVDWMGRQPKASETRSRIP
jgi:acetoin utilization protein AcuB